ncbi:hypothetical protein [Pseudomonas chlororaphis]|uniref:hypothetical protein n=1 Tax=Pseudomonas chlororaphis TaxID=587753 RepID=UPI001B30D16E|nr:hypothetical protein [Pseudomonas chlororaphis]MBP5057590.1 hypothetical protein [Pseudomonas chlororaphis]MBP5142119.1 hypothetical protein [Pseudomonas chlororaphis]QTT99106.1 hypothetical protein HUT26_07440 [Pseudomonas chlororaphis]
MIGPYSIGVDSMNRMQVVLGAYDSMTVNDWLTLLGETWSSCDRIGDHRDKLAGYLRDCERGELDLMMGRWELKVHRALPEVIQVWRGCYEFNSNGLSWSLSRDIAARFANPALHRYHHPGYEPLLLTGWVSRDGIVLKLDRREREVIAHTVWSTAKLARGASQLA